MTFHLIFLRGVVLLGFLMVFVPTLGCKANVTKCVNLKKMLAQINVVWFKK